MSGRTDGAAVTPSSGIGSENLVQEIGARLRRGLPVRRTLSPGGRLHIDRPLPFLCIFRLPVPAGEDACPRGDVSGRVLVRSEGSYLIAPGDPEEGAPVAALVQAVAGTQAERFGAFLLLEIWIGAPDSRTFRIVAPAQQAEGSDNSDAPPATVEVLREALLNIAPGEMGPPVPKVEVTYPGICAPPGLPPLLTTTQAEKYGCLMLGLEVPPIHRDDSGKLLPLTLRRLQSELSRALQKTFFDFARVQTNHAPPHYQALGRRAVVNAVWEADRELTAVDKEFDFLLSITPVNAEAAWTEFERSGFARPPVFHYRLLALDPDQLKRRLYNISLGRVEDPTLAHLFREKRRELDRQITLLEDRDTPAFLGGSLALYGDVSEELLQEAERILRDLPPVPPVQEDTAVRDSLDAAGIAERARAEIERYREQWPMLKAEVRIRGDIPGVMVAGENLLIGQRAKVAARRAAALIHHEIGTHVLTFVNGAAQPLKLLAHGLPDYEELQEGLAVLSEYLSGGLTRSRMRLLAARVVAVRCLTRGATFAEVFQLLCGEHGFTPRTAFTITMRVFRGGGLTKDAVYLRGLLQILRYLRSGGSPRAFWMGKLGLNHLPLIEELMWREVLRPAPLRPRYMDDPDGVARFEALKSQNISLRDLVSDVSR